jgi:sucrose-6-phosphate hydrolase SacC (GH32 family)
MNILMNLIKSQGRNWSYDPAATAFFKKGANSSRQINCLIDERVIFVFVTTSSFVIRKRIFFKKNKGGEL